MVRLVMFDDILEEMMEKSNKEMVLYGQKKGLEIKNYGIFKRAVILNRK